MVEKEREMSWSADAPPTHKKKDPFLKLNPRVGFLVACKVRELYSTETKEEEEEEDYRALVLQRLKTGWTRGVAPCLLVVEGRNKSK